MLQITTNNQSLLNEHSKLQEKINKLIAEQQLILDKQAFLKSKEEEIKTKVELSTKLMRSLRHTVTSAESKVHWHKDGEYFYIQVQLNFSTKLKPYASRVYNSDGSWKYRKQAQARVDKINKKLQDVGNVYMYQGQFDRQDRLDCSFTIK